MDLVKNITKKSAVILGCDLAGFVSLTPDNRPFSEGSMSGYCSTVLISFRFVLRIVVVIRLMRSDS